MARKSKFLRIALVVSVGLNLIVATAIGVGVFFGGPPEGLRSASSMHIVRAMPERYRKEFYEEIHSEYGDWKDKRQKSRGFKLSLIEALKTEPFSEPDLENVFIAQAKDQSASFKRGQQLLIKQIYKMSDADRKSFASGLETHSKRPHR